MRLVITRQLPQGPPFQLLVQLGQLARHHHRSIVAQPVRQVVQQLRQPVRRLEQDQGPGRRRGDLQDAAPLGPLARQKSQERVAVGREPGDAEGGRHGGGTGHRPDRHAGGVGTRHEPRAGIADGGGPGIGDQRDADTAGQLGDEVVEPVVGRVLVHADHRTSRPDVAQQDP